MKTDPLLLTWAFTTLYEISVGSATREQPWGTPDTSAVVWTGGKTHNLRLRPVFQEFATTGSGDRYPTARSVIVGHVIEWDRISVLRDNADSATAPLIYTLDPGQYYVLDVQWHQPPPATDDEMLWLARAYYGVRVAEESLGADRNSVAFSAPQTLRALFFRERQGIGVVEELT